MRIAFISLYNYAPWGGSEDLWVKTAGYAAQQGHQVVASLYDFGEKTSPKIWELNEQGVKLHFRKRFQDNKGMMGRLSLLLDNRVLKNKYNDIFRFKPEIIFINDPGTFIYIRTYGVLQNLIKKADIPYMIVCKLTPDYGTSISKPLRETARNVFGDAMQMLFVSHRMQSNVERFLAMKMTNGRVIQNPVNLPSHSIIAYPQLNTIHFAVVAHLTVSQKGQDILLEILSDNYWKEKEWKLNFYGEGIDKEYLIELSQLYGLSNKVIFHGHVDEINDIWKNNHILLFPTCSEGMPKAVVEAMICGRPVVAVDVGGISEILEEEFNGYIAEAPSVNSFNKSLTKAWQQLDRWEQVGKNAHSSVKKWMDPMPEKTLLNIITQNESKALIE